MRDCRANRITLRVWRTVLGGGGKSALSSITEFTELCRMAISERDENGRIQEGSGWSDISEAMRDGALEEATFLCSFWRRNRSPLGFRDSAFCGAFSLSPGERFFLPSLTMLSL